MFLHLNKDYKLAGAAAPPLFLPRGVHRIDKD